MNIVCRTCGGDCTSVSKSADSATYRCLSCGNVYIIKNGEIYPPAQEAKRPAKVRKPVYKEQVKTPVSDNPTVQKAPAVIDNIPAQKEPQKSNSPQTMPQPTANTALTGEQIYERNLNSVIELRGISGGKLYSGSGYAVDNKGTAITNAHVVKRNGKLLSSLKAYACGKTFSAEVVKVSGAEDLALIKITNPPVALRGVQFADISAVREGQTLYVIGNSMGDGTCITSGIVSDKRRMVGGKPRLMTDCAVNKGNSGGPVFNNYGKVVGTVVAVTTTAEGMNYAIPADIVLDFLSECGVDSAVK